MSKTKTKNENKRHLQKFIEKKSCHSHLLGILMDIKALVFFSLRIVASSLMFDYAVISHCTSLIVFEALYVL